MSRSSREHKGAKAPQRRSAATGARGARVLGKRARDNPAATAPQIDTRQFVDVLQLHEDEHAPAIFLPFSTPTSALDRDTSLLSHLLHPIPADSFFESHWQKRPLAVLGLGAARVARLIEEHMEGLDVAQLMANSASDSIFVWMKERAHRQEGALPSPEQERAHALTSPISSFPLDNPAQLDAALTCYAAGASLYFRSSSSLSRLFVRALNAAVGYGLWGLNSDRSEKGEIEVFCSRAGHVTGYHMDFQQNVTVQLKGKKTWIFAGQLCKHPLRGYTPHYADQSTAEMQLKALPVTLPQLGLRVPTTGDRVTLSAGDVLYHPAGVWHAVECDEDSVSINISLVATTMADVLADTVRQVMWSFPEARRGVQFSNRRDGDRQIASMWQLMQTRMARLTQERVIPRRLRGPPPPAVVRIRTSDALQSPRLEGFRRIPLWRCFRHPNQSQQDGDAEEGEEEQEGPETGVEDADEEKGQKRGGQEKVEESEAAVLYVCHYLYANEACESAVRVQLWVPEVYEGVLSEAVEVNPIEDLALNLNVVTGMLRVAAQRRCGVDVDEDGVQRVLQKLLEIGVITEVEEPRSAAIGIITEDDEPRSQLRISKRMP